MASSSLQKTAVPEDLKTRWRWGRWARSSSMQLKPAIYPLLTVAENEAAYSTGWSSDLDYGESTGWGQFVAPDKKGKDAHTFCYEWITESVWSFMSLV